MYFLKLINNSSKLNKGNHKHVYMYLNFFVRLMMKNFKMNHYRSGKIPQTFLNPKSSMNGVYNESQCFFHLNAAKCNSTELTIKSTCVPVVICSVFDDFMCSLTETCWQP